MQFDPGTDPNPAPAPAGEALPPAPPVAPTPPLEPTAPARRSPIPAILAVLLVLVVAGLAYWSISLNSRLSATRQATAELQSRFDDLSARNQQLTADYAQVTGDLTSAQATLNKANTDLATANKDLAAANDATKQAKADLAVTNAAKKALADKIKKALPYFQVMHSFFEDSIDPLRLTVQLFATNDEKFLDLFMKAGKSGNQNDLAVFLNYLFDTTAKILK